MPERPARPDDVLRDDVLRDDAALHAALRDVAGSLAAPPASAPGRPDLAMRVRARIVGEDVAPGRDGSIPAWRRVVRGPRGVRRGLVLASVLLLVIAATAGAIGLGVPGIRILFGPPPTATVPPPTASPSPGGSPAASPAPGDTIGLGELIPPAEVANRTAPGVIGFALRRPTDSALGQPDATYVAGRRVTMAWAPGPDLPPTTSPGVGLLLTEFRGAVEPEFFTKIVGPDTRIERVEVDGVLGYWITGEIHIFFAVDERGNAIDESRRVVGDTLVWTNDGVTYRLEIAAGLERALEIAASLR